MKTEVVAASFEHAFAVARNLSQETADDLIRGWAVKDFDARIIEAVETTESYAVLADGKVMCIFGISDLNIAWFLPTADFERIAFRFVRHCKEFFAEWMETRSVIYSYIYEGNTKMVRWLEWCGFEFVECVSVNGHNYRRYRLCACQPSR